MLYTLITDTDRYRDFFFNEDQILELIGELDQSTVDKRIDLNGVPRSYKGIINEPLIFNFQTSGKKNIPDLQVHYGRLFLSAKAYAALKSHIEDDGEFLPVRYEKGEGYFFIPLQVAMVDPEKTSRDSWGEIVSLGFKREAVKDFNLFRTEFNDCMGLYCQEKLKDVIEQAELTGLYITNDLANIFPEPRGEAASLNS